jgi:hypothetical protein
MAVWVGKNLVEYGRPVYGGAFGFLPPGAPAGALAGLGLLLRYLWELNPIVLLLGVVGLGFTGRRAPLLVALLGLSAIVPWYTVSALPVEVAFQTRLMVVPLVLLAPFAGAVAARATARWPITFALALLVVAGQAAYALRAEYPSAPLPMTSLARALDRSGTFDRFDAIYVQSPRPTGYPDEVRVATNFRRPVKFLPLEPARLPWADGDAEAILLLNDGRDPPAGSGPTFVVQRAPPMVAWGICHGRTAPDDGVEWPEVSAPSSVAAAATVTVSLKLVNSGRRTWRPTACGAVLAYRWFGADGRPSGEAGAVALSSLVEPGQATALSLAVPTPPSPGPHVLEIDLLPHREAPFGTGGSGLRLSVEVTRAAG